VTDAPAANPYRIDVVHRTVRILMEFRQPPHAFGVAELARRTGVSSGSCFRIIKTLEESGLVRRDAGDGRYRVGLAALELAHAAGRSLDLVSLADDVMRDLEAQTQETVNLLVRDGWGAVCVAQREGSMAIRVPARVGGRRNALHAGASQKAILAALPDGEIAQYIREHGLNAITPATITEPEALWREVAAIRSAGVAWSNEDTELGVQAVAAAVIDGAGRAVAAMAVAGPMERFRGQRGDRIRGAVQEGAATISRRMGFFGRPGEGGRAQPDPADPTEGDGTR
jgi:DNA-binding IclR family transcriptional regulator